MPYVTAVDLQILLGIGYPAASKTWHMMSDADDKELGIYRTQMNKVRLRPALKRLGLSYKELCDQYGITEASKKIV